MPLLQKDFALRVDKLNYLFHGAALLALLQALLFSAIILLRLFQFPICIVKAKAADLLRGLPRSERVVFDGCAGRRPSPGRLAQCVTALIRARDALANIPSGAGEGLRDCEEPPMNVFVAVWRQLFRPIIQYAESS